VQAAELAISSPLLEASIDGAYGVLLSIQGGSDLGLFEINEAARLVQEAAHPEANIIFGAVIDDALGDEVRVTVIAAGFDGGVPTKRSDDRALGQITGSSRSAAASPSSPAPSTAPGPASSNGSSAAASSGSWGGSASQRPYPGSAASAGSSTGEPGSASHATSTPAPGSSPTAVPTSGGLGDDEPFVVPDSLEPVRVGRAQRGVVFDDSDDDLDVPDFLK
jgi:cell division protein FtsZ